MTDLDELNGKLFTHPNVEAIDISMDNRNNQYHLLLTLRDNDDGKGQIVIYFMNISNLRMQEIGGGLTQFMHLEVSRTNDAILLVEDVENDLIHLECSEIDDVTVSG